MHIAWFRADAPDASNPLDDTAALIDELRSTHAIEVIVEAGAHDFVWRHALKPWDLCVYELDNTGADQFEWGYLLNYAGVVMLKSPYVQNSWGASRSREGRLNEYMAGFRFVDPVNTPPLLRVPLLASRSVVIPHAELAQSLQETYPEARVRFAPTGVRGVATNRAIRHDSRRLVVWAPGNHRAALVARAVERARAAAEDVELITSESVEHVVDECDVVVALRWPPYEKPLTAALVGMAAGKAVVTLEVEATAGWPALDPQTWRPRGLAATDSPIAVTLDPRDEEHSLMLALRRLATDAPLREQLGDAAHAWWQAHATPAHAAAAWNQILREAASLTPPLRPPDWPKHLGADGTELARSILNEFRLTSDI